jgi:hypothetical protein
MCSRSRLQDGLSKQIWITGWVISADLDFKMGYVSRKGGIAG